MNSHPPAPLRRLVALAALSLTLLLPTAASAQTPSEDGYETDGPTVQNQIESGSAGEDDSGAATPAGSSDRGGGESASLPFTGMDLGMLLGAGVLLVGLGAGMRLVLRLPPPVR